MKYKIINSGPNSTKDKNNIVLHKNIMEILFKHKHEIFKRFSDIKGVFHIDHIAIKIINPANEMVIFSITPSVEYNLIAQELWRHDHDFLCNNYKLNKLYMWEESYSKRYFSEIKYIKELKHGFTFGFNIFKKYENFNLIYSFATRSQNNDLRQYYKNHTHEIIELGDYSYKLIHDIYIKYCQLEFAAPFISDKKSFLKRPYLKLIINK